MAFESVRAIEWTYGVLSGDSTLSGILTGGVWRGVAPDNTAYPYAIIQLQSAPDVLNATAWRIYANILLTIKVVGLWSGYTTLQSAADRIDALLGRTNGTQGGSTVAACFREAEIPIPDEVIGGITISTLAAEYRLQVTTP